MSSSPHSLARLLILGGGFTGLAVARLARAAAVPVVATTRTKARVDVLEAEGVTPLLVPTLSSDALAPHVDERTAVLVTFPPDGTTDAALAPAMRRAGRVAYVSSTGVYGGLSGVVDEDTPIGATTPRGAARLSAESAWRGIGAVVMRAAAIYGPGRGMHLRLARGELRLPGEGTQTVSRIHVDDLARGLWTHLAGVTRGSDEGAVYVMADDEPAPHREVVAYLCDRLGVPFPPRVPLESADETLRQDRRIDASRSRARLGMALLYPTYREGYGQCLREDAAALADALAAARRGTPAG